MATVELTITSTAFEHNGYMPVEYTGYGIDQSPPLTLSRIVTGAKTIAITMVDLDVPFIREYPHWVFWNFPAAAEIPGAIPKGKILPELNGARQGLAYGKHTYRGPKPPRFIRKRHRYVFTVYVLDTELNLNDNTDKKSLLKAMQGHVLDQGSIIGLYRNR